MTDSQFIMLPTLPSEFARGSDSSGDEKHGDKKHDNATITAATILSLRSYIANLENRLAAKNAIIDDLNKIIDDLNKKVTEQETTIQNCFTELDARPVYDAKTVIKPRPDVSLRNSLIHGPVSATRITQVPRDPMVTIALEDVSYVYSSRK
jgi:uncharacterized coiled-coil protein SlyX